jgi:hypothetical protein
MFETVTEQLDRGRGLKAQVCRAGKALSYAEVIGLWQSEPAFCSVFISILSAAPYSAFRWETPPLTATCLDRQFEFVLLDSPGLDVPPDASAFAELFASAAGQDVISFPSLGHDALLVAPLPRGPKTAYGHLAAFSRHAPEAQNHALWQAVGHSLARAAGQQPVWVSTAGSGVAWLHVRLDTWPKYYGYGPYREAPHDR